MAGLDDLLKALPLDQIAGKLGVDAGTAQSAVNGLMPAILGGLKANADDPQGAASIQQALTQHTSALVDGGVNMDDVDEADGAKIASHIFGPHQDAVVAKVAETTGTQASLISKLLPALAPIAMSFIAKQMSGGGQAGGGGGGGGGGLGGLLGSIGHLFGGKDEPAAAPQAGATQAAAAQGGGLDLGGVLGGLLGGGSAGGGGGGLDIGSILGGLGGLLGGGRR